MPIPKKQQGISATLCVLLLAAAACTQSSPSEPATPSAAAAVPQPEAGVVVKGLGISPQGFPLDYSHFIDFLEEAGTLPNGGVMFNGAWRNDVEGGTDSGQPPDTAVTIMEQAAKYSYTPIIVFGWRSDDQNLHLSLPDNPADDWSNDEAKDRFEEMLVDFTGTYHPPYLFLGNESDAYYTANPDDYARWVEFYNRAYDAVKAVSPETLIGPIFQYERMSGQGFLNNWTAPQWGALEAHDLGRVDMVGLTFYPWLAYASPEEIPGDYLAPLRERIGDIPIAITETGWPAEELGLDAPWERSPEAQVRYLEALGRVLDGTEVKLVDWLLLYPMAEMPDQTLFWQSFSSLSLRDAQGDKRPVYDAWAAFQP